MRTLFTKTNFFGYQSTHRFKWNNTLFYLIFPLLVASCIKIDNTIDSVEPENAEMKQVLKRQGGTKPNIVLILADDVGYEIPSYSGGTSYKTPHIDRLAKEGMQFTECHAAPNCTPSRVMLMTGKYNFRNYTGWRVLDTSQYTFANLLKDEGYQTMIAGKWQLDGGKAAMEKFGFRKQRVFDPISSIDENDANQFRYKNPHLYQNGIFMPDTASRSYYSEDLFVSYITNFIDDNADRPFFIYYPLSLCHTPFSPSPDDPDYDAWNPWTSSPSKKYFPGMVSYMDKVVGQIVNKIEKAGLTNNTIIIFAGDNGTPNAIVSLFNGIQVPGSKGQTTEYGTHVPLIVKWPGKIAAGSVNNNLVDFPDFLPTMAEMAGTSVPPKFGTTDGISFYSQLTGGEGTVRTYSFCHWDPGNTRKFSRWAQTTTYKLYDYTDRNAFFNIEKDINETHPLSDADLTAAELLIKQQLHNILLIEQ